MRKIREWLNIQLVKNPGKMVLFVIFLFNVILLFGASSKRLLQLDSVSVAAIAAAASDFILRCFIFVML